MPQFSTSQPLLASYSVPPLLIGSFVIVTSLSGQNAKGLSSPSARVFPFPDSPQGSRRVTADEEMWGVHKTFWGQNWGLCFIWASAVGFVFPRLFLQKKRKEQALSWGSSGWECKLVAGDGEGPGCVMSQLLTSRAKLNFCSLRDYISLLMLLGGNF